MTTLINEKTSAPWSANLRRTVEKRIARNKTLLADAKACSDPIERSIIEDRLDKSMTETETLLSTLQAITK